MTDTQSIKTIDVEYSTQSARYKLAGVRYHGVIQRKSDCFTVLSIQKLDSSRRQNIEVGGVISVAVDGVRHVLDIEPHRWQLRAVELSRLIDGTPWPDWAEPYFDPDSPKFHKRPRARDEHQIASQNDPIIAVDIAGDGNGMKELKATMEAAMAVLNKGGTAEPTHSTKNARVARTPRPAPEPQPSNQEFGWGMAAVAIAVFALLLLFAIAN